MIIFLLIIWQLFTTILNQLSLLICSLAGGHLYLERYYPYLILWFSKHTDEGVFYQPLFCLIWCKFHRPILIWPIANVGVNDRCDKQITWDSMDCYLELATVMILWNIINQILTIDSRKILTYYKGIIKISWFQSTR